MPVCFLMKYRNNMGPDERGDEGDLGGIGEGKQNILFERKPTSNSINR